MLLTVREVAKDLRVNTNMAYRLINAGLLPSIKIGSTKVRPEALKEFLITYEGEDIEKMSPKYGRTEIKNVPLEGAATPNGHIANKPLKVYLMIEEKKRRKL